MDTWPFAFTVCITLVLSVWNVVVVYGRKQFYGYCWNPHEIHKPPITICQWAAPTMRRAEPRVKLSWCRPWHHRCVPVPSGNSLWYGEMMSQVKPTATLTFICSKICHLLWCLGKHPVSRALWLCSLLLFSPTAKAAGRQLTDMVP